MRCVLPLSYTLDHWCPLYWPVEDSALTTQVIAGDDPADPASPEVPVPDFIADIGQDLAGLRIGYTCGFFVDDP
jgi:Asp-tRNA(Asn)/Glu-tRNA(Gln) amidotransferase A subunit family amidase